MKPSAFVLAVVVLAGFLSRAEAGDGPHIVVAPVEGEIDVGRAHLVDRAVTRAVEGKARALVLVVDTPGGSVIHMSAIARSLDRARDGGVETVAFVKGWAWSAGAIICVAADRIYMRPTASIGAAQPVVLDGSSMKAASEKVVSALRAEARAYAQKTGKSAALVEAMVDPDAEVLEVSTAEGIRYMSRRRYEDVKGRAEAAGEVLAVRSTVVEKGKLLSLSAGEARSLGLVDGLADTLEKAVEAAGHGDATVIRVRLTWSQRLANFLSHPVVSSLLFILGVLGFYVEFKTPGFGLPGILGAAFLAVFFFGKYTVGLAEVYEILVFVAGLGLIALEIFLLPGFGIPGVLGIILVMAGLFLSSQDFLLPEGPGDVSKLKENLFFTTLSLTGTVACAMALGYVLPKTPFMRRLVLTPPSGGPEGVPAPTAMEGLLDKVGRAETVLRPAGKALFGDRPVDVVSEGDFVEPGTLVRVVRVEGNRVVVRPEEEKA